MREIKARGRKAPGRGPARRAPPPARLPGWLGPLLRHPGDSIAALVAAAAMSAIVANGLLWQPGPHPAPIFPIQPLPVVSREAAEMNRVPRPRPAAAAVSKPEPAPPPMPKIDPVPLPRRRAQIPDQAPTEGARPDPIAALMTPARQVSTMQRVLNEFGYGPIKVTGTFDGETRQGIARFERDHNLPVTGQNSPRLRRALGLATGRSLE